MDQHTSERVNSRNGTSASLHRAARLSTRSAACRVVVGVRVGVGEGAAARGLRSRDLTEPEFRFVIVLPSPTVIRLLAGASLAAKRYGRSNKMKQNSNLKNRSDELRLAILACH
eukprot:2736595-Pleurochrysis_carterae.AAC.3